MVFSNLASEVILFTKSYSGSRAPQTSPVMRGKRKNCGHVLKHTKSYKEKQKKEMIWCSIRLSSLESTHDYQAAANSGLEIHPPSMSQFWSHCSKSWWSLSTMACRLSWVGFCFRAFLAVLCTETHGQLLFLPLGRLLGVRFQPGQETASVFWEMGEMVEAPSLEVSWAERKVCIWK